MEEGEKYLLDRILSPGSSHYEVLGVPRDAPTALITKQYRLLAKQFHPDTYHGAYSSEAMEAFKRFSASAEVLRDDSARREYDEILRQQQAHTRGVGTARGTSEDDPIISEEEKERQWYRANIFFLREMLTLLHEDSTADISDYSPAILATFYLGTVDLFSFFLLNPLFFLPLAFIGLYLIFSSNATHQEIMDRISWNNLSEEMKMKLVEFLIAYNEYRLAEVTRPT